MQRYDILMQRYDNGELLYNLSICIISDNLDHDTNMVYQIKIKVIKIIKEELPSIKMVEYFSDGCAAQYKNFKNILNSCCHKEDFQIDANWTLLATSYGKSPCDGIGGSVKRLTARASLQRPYSEQILTASQMLLFCQKNIANIRFLFISKEEIVDVREQLKIRFSSGTHLTRN